MPVPVALDIPGPEGLRPLVGGRFGIEPPEKGIRYTFGGRVFRIRGEWEWLLGQETWIVATLEWEGGALETRLLDWALVRRYRGFWKRAWDRVWPTEPRDRA